MKAVFAAGLALCSAALAAPLSAKPGSLKPITGNKVQMTIFQGGQGYLAYEDIPIDGPALTVGRLWKGSSIDDNVDVTGAFISVNSTLGNKIKCALQDQTRHDIVVLSEGNEIQDITGNSKKIKLTNHVVFCYTTKPGSTIVPIPHIKDEPAFITHVDFEVTNKATKKSAIGRVTVDSKETWRFIDAWHEDEQLYKNGHVYATDLTIESFLDGVQCHIYNGENHEIAVIGERNKDETVLLDYTPGADIETAVDDFTIACKRITPK